MGLFAKRAAPASASAGASRTAAPVTGSSYFGKSIAITGTVSGEDPVTFHGQLEGEIRIKGPLVIGRQARIEGVVQAESIAAGGRIDGEVTVANTLHLESSASLSGRALAARLSVQEGAVFNGELKMGTRQGGESTP